MFLSAQGAYFRVDGPMSEGQFFVLGFQFLATSLGQDGFLILSFEMAGIVCGCLERDSCIGGMSEAGFAGFGNFQDGGGRAGTGLLLRAMDKKF